MDKKHQFRIIIPPPYALLFISDEGFKIRPANQEDLDIADWYGPDARERFQRSIDAFAAAKRACANDSSAPAAVVCEPSPATALPAPAADETKPEELVHEAKPKRTYSKCNHGHPRKANCPTCSQEKTRKPRKKRAPVSPLEDQSLAQSL